MNEWMARKMASKTLCIVTGTIILFSAAFQLIYRTASAVVTPPVAPVYRATAQGRLDSATEMRTLVSERDGVITTINVRPGQFVHRNQILLRIGCGDIQAQLAAAEARSISAAAAARLVREGPREEVVQGARARLSGMISRAKDAHDLYNRIHGLGSSGTVAWRQITQAKNALDSAEADELAVRQDLAALEHGSRPAEIEVAEARIAEAKADTDVLSAVLRKCTILAPIDGQVLRLYKREGEFSGASQGAAVLSLGDTDRMIVRMEIDERDAATVSLGAPAVIWINGSDLRYRGHITELSMQMGRKTVRSLDPSDRYDRDIREGIVAIDDPAVPHLVGLRVNIGIEETPNGPAHSEKH